MVAYQRLEFLTQAIKNELQRDLQINDAGVLPPDIVLPQITAAEYGRVCLPYKEFLFVMLISVLNAEGSLLSVLTSPVQTLLYLEA